MKHDHLSPEEEAEQTLGSLDGLLRTEAPAALEEKLFARVASVSARLPKWCWAAAVALLLVNAVALVNFTRSSGVQTESSLREVGTYYFSGGNDWFSQSN